MEELLKNDVTLCWNDDCKKILDLLKEKMVTMPILVFHDWKKEFHLHVDASCIALGVILTQVGGGGFNHPIVFARKMLSKVEKNYSTTEQRGSHGIHALEV